MRRIRRLIARLLLPAAASCMAALVAVADEGAVRYVDDVITINVRAAPDTGAGTTGFISSGARVVVLERDDDSGFSRVRLESGEEGWVRHQFLAGQPVARDRLAAAEDMAGRLRAERDEAVADLTRIRAERDELATLAGGLEEAKIRLQEELDEIRAASAEALALRDRASELEVRVQDERLQREQAEAAATAAGNRLLLVGGGAAAVGLALGFFIGSTPIRREKRWARVD